MKFLITAVLVELLALTFLKRQMGFPYSLIPISLLVLSYFIFEKALATIPISIAYAMWAGIGIVGSVLIGRALFQETLSAANFVFIIFITAGIIGLSLTK